MPIAQIKIDMLFFCDARVCRIKADREILCCYLHLLVMLADDDGHYQRKCQDLSLADEISGILGCDLALAEKVIAQLSAARLMVAITEDGFLLPQTLEMVSSSTSTDRVRRHRTKKRDERDAAATKDNITPPKKDKTDRFCAAKRFDFSGFPPEEVEVIHQWIKYRAGDKKKPYKTQRGIDSLRKELLDLSSRGVLIDSIHYSIGKEWQAVYERKDKVKDGGGGGFLAALDAAAKVMRQEDFGYGED